MADVEAPHMPIDPGVKSLGDALRISFRLTKAIMFLVLLLFLCSGVFVVGQHEEAVVLRFGRFTGFGPEQVRKPGIHWAWPYPIDQVVKISVGRDRVLVVAAFWPELGREARIEGADVKVKVGLLEPGKDGYNITGDRNLVHTIWSVRYKIDDIRRYLVKLGQPQPGSVSNDWAELGRLISATLENTVIRVIGRFDVNDVLREGKARLVSQVQRGLQDRMADLDVGVRVEQVLLNRVEPPGKVADAFSAVIRAEQTKDKVLQDAKAYAGSLAEQARGEEALAVAEAEAYKTLISEKARSDADYIKALLAECKGDREKLDLFLMRQQMDAVAEFLVGAREKFVLRPEGEGGARELRLLINRDPEAAKHWQATHAETQSEPATEQPDEGLLK